VAFYARGRAVSVHLFQFSGEMRTGNQAVERESRTSQRLAF
jgi:predicted solute-binding protein